MLRFKCSGSKRAVIPSYVIALVSGSYGALLNILGCLIPPPRTSRDSQE